MVFAKFKNLLVGKDDSHPTLHILILEDESTIFKLVVRILKTMNPNFKIDHAMTIPQAIDILEVETIDLIIADINLPPGDVTGADFWDIIQSDLKGNDFIFMSGVNKDSFIQVHENIRDVPFIQKPFKPEEFKKVVQEHLDAQLVR
jgi:two-component SAPR family response regulator